MPKPLRLGIWLLCSLALALRVTGMHVHLAGDHLAADDGPPQPSMHIADVGPDHEFHHEHGHGHDHADPNAHASFEVSLENQALSKKIGDNGPGIWLIAAALILFICPLLEPPWLRPRAFPQKLRRTPHLRPPLRGPPLNA